MRGGRLRHTCEILQKQVLRDVYGQEVVSYEVYRTRRCREIPERVSQQQEQDRTTAKANVLFSIRHTPGIDATMRLRVQGRELDIVGVSNPDDKRRETILTCQELVND